MEPEEDVKTLFLGRAEQLADLMRHHAWPVYEGLLIELRTARLEELASALDPAQMRAIQGAAQVLGQLLSLPKEILEAAAILNKEDAPQEVTLAELKAILDVDLKAGA